jgi:hypothetical protein
MLSPEAFEDFRELAAQAKARDGLSQGELVEQWIVVAKTKRRRS